jgi:tetratricopeptide (TPR) repeat protein
MMKFLDVSEVPVEGNVQDAIGKLRAVSAQAPDLASVWVQLAELLEKSGALSEANEALTVAQRLVPNSPRIALMRDRLDVALGVTETDGVDPVTSEPEPAPSPKPGHVASLDIDLLIADLQSGRTQAENAHAESESDDADRSESQEIATETLAKIFENQKLFTEASRMYDLLADQESRPEKAEIFRARSEDLRKRVSERSR